MDWIAAVKDVGFPIVAYGAIMAAIWAIIKWIASDIVTPIRERAFKFIDKLEGNVDKMSMNLEQQTATLKEIHGTQGSIETGISTLVSQGCGINSRNVASECEGDKRHG